MATPITDHNPMTLPASIPDLPSSHTGPAQPCHQQCGISTSTHKHLAYMPMLSLGVNSTRQGRFLKRRSRKFLDLTIPASRSDLREALAVSVKYTKYFDSNR